MSTLFKTTFLIILISALMVSSFPVFEAGDMNNDHSVDLQDLVLSAKNIARTGDLTDDFIKEFKGFYAAARVVAGFRHIIKEKDGTAISISASQVYLMPSRLELPGLCAWSLPSFNLQSAFCQFYPPDPRPPRA